MHGVPADLLAWQTDLRVPPGEDLVALLTRHDGYVNGDLPDVALVRERVPIREVGGWRLTADVTVPRGRGPFACLVYLHGGGWTLGSPATHRRLAADLAVLGLVVVSVDYRRAPRHRFPAAVDDTAFAVRWAHDHAAEFQGDPARMLLGGDSAGANLAAAALATADLPEVCGALLLYGVYDFHRALPLLTALTGGPDGPSQHYVDPAAFDRLRGDPRLSPDRAVAGFPPCWLTVGGLDPLRRETEAMAAALAAAAVPHQVHVVAGAPHAYLQLPTHPAHAEAWRPLGAFLDEYGLRGAG